MSDSAPASGDYIITHATMLAAFELRTTGPYTSGYFGSYSYTAPSAIKYVEMYSGEYLWGAWFPGYCYWQGQGSGQGGSTYTDCLGYRNSSTTFKKKSTSLSGISLIRYHANLSLSLSSDKKTITITADEYSTNVAGHGNINTLIIY